MIDTVAVALEKGERMPPAEAQDLADDMLTAEVALYERLMISAFPDLKKAGKTKAPKSKS